MIIAEIGTSHEGSLEKAFQLVDAAADSGADAIKFQWVYADEILHPKTGMVILNQYYGNNAVCISELGLFASSVPGTDDLLASIKLANYEDQETQETATNTLYVRPDDTLIVRWVITIAAIGKDSVLKANVSDEYGNIITTTITKIPDIGNIDIIVNPPIDENNGG